jgi:DNA-binding transcriptional regulator WhiA
MKKIKPRQRKPRKWTEDKVEFLKENYKKLPYKTISDYLGLTYAAIVHKAGRLGLDSRHLWTEEENNIIKNEYWCNPDVWDLFPDRGRDSITVQARKLGVQRQCGNYPVNFRFFEDWNADSAYVLGFFMADGCVEPKYNRISCELSMRDYDHLVNIRNLIGSRNPICVKKRRNSCSLAIHNRKMVNDVVSKGMIPRKTTRVRLPYMPTEVFKDFLRGYIDGDGSIYYNDGKYLRLQILGNLKYIKDMHEKILSLYGVTGHISEHNKHLGRKNCYRLMYYSAKARAILDDIYYNDCFTLTRKLELARGVIPGKINTTQISQTSSYGTGEPEGKTDTMSDPAETTRGAPFIGVVV